MGINLILIYIALSPNWFRAPDWLDAQWFYLSATLISSTINQEVVGSSPTGAAIKIMVNQCNNTPLYLKDGFLTCLLEKVVGVKILIKPSRNIDAKVLWLISGVKPSGNNSSPRGAKKISVICGKTRLKTISELSVHW